MVRDKDHRGKSAKAIAIYKEELPTDNFRSKKSKRIKEIKLRNYAAPTPGKPGPKVRYPANKPNPDGVKKKFYLSKY